MRGADYHFVARPQGLGPLAGDANAVDVGAVGGAVVYENVLPIAHLDMGVAAGGRVILGERNGVGRLPPDGDMRLGEREDRAGIGAHCGDQARPNLGHIGGPTRRGYGLRGHGARAGLAAWAGKGRNRLAHRGRRLNA